MMFDKYGKPAKKTPRLLPLAILTARINYCMYRISLSQRSKGAPLPQEKPLKLQLTFKDAYRNICYFKRGRLKQREYIILDLLH